MKFFVVVGEREREDGGQMGGRRPAWSSKASQGTNLWSEEGPE